MVMNQDSAVQQKNKRFSFTALLYALVLVFLLQGFIISGFDVPGWLKWVITFITAMGLYYLMSRRIQHKSTREVLKVLGLTLILILLLVVGFVAFIFYIF